MTNENATGWVQAGRSAWPRTLGIALSCAVAALALESTTAAYAQMGENALTTGLTLTPGNDTVQRFCSLGDACGDDGAIAGNFGGVWRNSAFVEPDARSFPGIRFIGKSLSAVVEEVDEDDVVSERAFDVYCSTEGESQACVEIEDTGNGGGGGGLCHGIISVIPQPNDCPEDFDYKVEYDKLPPTVLKLCKTSIKATCLTDDSALVTDGRIVAYRALFDYDCTRYCRGGCCRF